MPLDKFTKRHFGNWAIVVLVALNLLVIGTFWVTHLLRPPLAPLPVDSNRPGLEGEEMPDLLPFLTRELGFSRSQMRKLREMREQTLPAIRLEWQEMHQLRRKVHENLFRDDVDPNEIQQWSERIGEIQAKLEWTKYQHLLAIKSICTRLVKEKAAG